MLVDRKMKRKINKEEVMVVTRGRRGSKEMEESAIATRGGEGEGRG